jgi:hypothetical protein
MVRHNFMAGSIWWNKGAHFMADRKQKERKGLGIKCTLHKHAPTDLLFPKILLLLQFRSPSSSPFIY